MHLVMLYLLRWWIRIYFMQVVQTLISDMSMYLNLPDINLSDTNHCIVRALIGDLKGTGKDVLITEIDVAYTSSHGKMLDRLLHRSLVFVAYGVHEAPLFL